MKREIFESHTLRFWALHNLYIGTRPWEEKHKSTHLRRKKERQKEREREKVKATISLKEKMRGLFIVAHTALLKSPSKDSKKKEENRIVLYTMKQPELRRN